MFVGIDVAKNELVIALRPMTRRWAVSNDEASARTLATELKALHPEAVILEATGGYELVGVAALAAAGLPVAVVNPRQVREVARASGRLRRSRRPSTQDRGSQTGRR